MSHQIKFYTPPDSTTVITPDAPSPNTIVSAITVSKGKVVTPESDATDK